MGGVTNEQEPSSEKVTWTMSVHSAPVLNVLGETNKSKDFFWIAAKDISQIF
jgi:hypothetical protein